MKYTCLSVYTNCSKQLYIIDGQRTVGTRREHSVPSNSATTHSGPCFRFLREWHWLRPREKSSTEQEKILQQRNTHQQDFPILKPGSYQQKFSGHEASVNLAVNKKVTTLERTIPKIGTLCFVSSMVNPESCGKVIPISRCACVSNSLDSESMCFQGP